MMLHLSCFNLVLVPKAGFKIMAISAPSILFPQTKFLVCATALSDILKDFSNLNDSMVLWYCGLLPGCRGWKRGCLPEVQLSTAAHAVLCSPQPAILPLTSLPLSKQVPDPRADLLSSQQRLLPRGLLTGQPLQK